MRPKTITVSPDVADPNGISVAQTPVASGNLTITGDLATGGVATFDIARHVSITSDGNDSGVTFTITGTDRNGDALTESITGPGSTTVNGNRNFLTVTQVAIDGAGTGNIEVGSADELETKWYPADTYKSQHFSYSIQVSSGASLTHKLEFTLDDVYASAFTEYGAAKFEDLGAETTDQVSKLDTQLLTAYRLSITGFSSGTATLRVLQ